MNDYLLQRLTSLKNADSPMVVIEIFPDCVADPIRLACVFGRGLSDMVGVVVCNDDPPADAIRYLLYVKCGEANIDAIAELYSLHYGPDGEGRGETLAKHRDAFCVHDEGCALCALSVKELLFPLLVDELRPYKSAVQSHRYN